MGAEEVMEEGDMTEDLIECLLGADTVVATEADLEAMRHTNCYLGVALICTSTATFSDWIRGYLH